jgi:cell division protein FtsB
MKFFRSWLNRIFVLGGVLVLLLLVMDLNSRMVHMVQLRAEMEAELDKVIQLRAIEAALDEQIAYAESDDIVEKWARQENWMQREGDYIIMLIPNGEPPQELFVQTAAPQQQLENWEAWKLWLTFQE